MNLSKILGSVVLLIFLPLSALGQDEAVPGMLSVKYLPGFSGSLPSALEVQSIEPAFPLLESPAARKRALPQSVLDLKRIHTVRYTADITPEQAAAIVSRQYGVEYAEPVYTRVPTGATPNDPFFRNVDYMERIKITEAWDVVKGEDGDVLIAVVDGGTRWDHPDLSGNLWTNPNEIPGNGVDDDGNGFADDVHGWNFAMQSQDYFGDDRDDHGTATAGVVAAVADNGTGMAGISWNAKFMAVGVRGVDAWGFHYIPEGIMYAAIMGADIINASFGGFYPRRTENDAIEAATDLGSLIIVAGGNLPGWNMELFRQYPAAHPRTMSVCGTEGGSDKNAQNYGYTIDVCAAGVDVLAPNLDGTYSGWWGTSFAAPIVSGVAALVKTRFPHYTAEQVREQIRATSDNIDAVNGADFTNLLGRGRVNALRAVTEENAVSVRSSDFVLTDESGDGLYDPEEEITVQFTVTNYLAPVDGLTIELRPTSGHVTTSGTITTGPMATGESLAVTGSFRASRDVPYRTFLFVEPVIRTPDGTVVSGGDAARMIMSDAKIVKHKTDAFTLDVTSEGNLGYVNQGWIAGTDYVGIMGEGMVLGERNFQNLPEGGLVLGRRAKVASSVFQKWSDYFQNQDFYPTTPLLYREDANDYQYTHVTLRADRLRLNITQETLVDPFLENVVLLRYIVHNNSSSHLNTVHVGFFNDWSAGRFYWDDVAGYIEGHHITYTAGSTDDIGDVYLGVAAISDTRKHSKSYDYNIDQPRDPDEAWDGMTGGVDLAAVGEQLNWTQLISTGPHEIPAWSSDTTHFALIYGRTEDNLVESLGWAKDLLNEWLSNGGVFVNTEEEPVSTEFVLHGNYPNPFRQSTQITFDMPEPGSVSLQVIDVLGRTVRSYAKRELPAGPVTWELDGGGLAAGVYLYRLTAGPRTLTGKMHRVQ